MKEIISAIHATPETVESFLKNNEYVIPDYQRPYSWGKEECIRLWEDLTTYYKDNKTDGLTDDLNSPYFLGNIIFYEEHNRRCVVDGQQRLITLSLLVKALSEIFQDYKVFEDMLYKKDQLTTKIKKPLETRIENNVLGEDEDKKLKNVILENNDNIKSISIYKENYSNFSEEIKNYFREMNFTADEKEKFIKFFLNKVILLPIKCTDIDSALTIFETTNNRGMDLSDSDIFKSKLYKFSVEEEEKASFIKMWDNFIRTFEDYNLDNTRTKTDLKKVFSQYMHVLRGKEKITESIIALRKFYDNKGSERLRNWKNVMNSLDKLMWGWRYITGNETTEKGDGAPVELLNLCSVMSFYSNTFWEYPVMTFLHNNIHKKDGDFRFIKNDELITLLKETARYCYWKWLNEEGITEIKYTISKVVSSVSHSGNYRDIYKKSIDSDLNEMKDLYKNINDTQFIKNSIKNKLSKPLNKKFRKGIVILSSCLHDQQNSEISKDIQIEHILPKKWENYKYDQWDQNKYSQHCEELGNLVPLEKTLNIKSRDNFFCEKKIYYAQSDITEVRELSNLRDWTPDQFKKRQTATIERLSNFFLS